MQAWLDWVDDSCVAEMSHVASFDPQVLLCRAVVCNTWSLSAGHCPNVHIYPALPASREPPDLSPV